MRTRDPQGGGQQGQQSQHVALTGRGRVNQPTLYRMYDFIGCLLYVGRTISPASRLRNHRLDKDWWDDIVTIKLERFDSIAELTEAETIAIRDEHPIHNIVGDSLRNRIAAIGREIDKVYGTPPGTSLKGVYYYYWPPEQCTPHQFEVVHAMAIRDLKAARLIVTGVPASEAFDVIEMPAWRP